MQPASPPLTRGRWICSASRVKPLITRRSENFAALELDSLMAARHDDAKAAQVRARNDEATTPQQMKADARTVEVQAMVAPRQSAQIEGSWIPPA